MNIHHFFFVFFPFPESCSCFLICDVTPMLGQKTEGTLGVKRKDADVDGDERFVTSFSEMCFDVEPLYVTFLLCRLIGCEVACKHFQTPTEALRGETF